MNSSFKSKILNSKTLGAQNRPIYMQHHVVSTPPPPLSSSMLMLGVNTEHSSHTPRNSILVESRPPMLLRQVLQQHYQEHY